MKILVDNKEQLITLSEILIEREVLDFKEVDSIMKTGKLPEVAELEEPATDSAPEIVAETEAPDAESESV